jgi:glucose-1-phosphatase
LDKTAINGMRRNEWAGVKTLLLDFGGVLFDIDYRLPIEAFAKLGYEDFGTLYTQAAQNKWFDDLETGKIDIESFYIYLHSFVPNAQRIQVVDAWNSILLTLRVKEVAFVKRMRNNGLRTLMLSNTNAIHVAEFEKTIDQTMGLEQFRDAFDEIYYSNVIGIKKPYPSTFLSICSRNGILPSETLFIDDSIQHVNGAIEAGMLVHHLLPHEKISEVLFEFEAE